MLQVTCHMWNVTWDTWTMTHMWGEHSLKISALLLYQFGNYDILKIWGKGLPADWINKLQRYFCTLAYFLYPGCEKNLHIWFVQKNYISTFLGTFYKICQYSPASKFSVLKSSFHIFVLIFLVRHWGSYLFWRYLNWH